LSFFLKKRRSLEPGCVAAKTFPLEGEVLIL